MRNLKALPVVLLLAAAPLAACGSNDDDKDDAKKADCADYQSGSSSDAVKVSGEFGQRGPKATFKAPLTVKADDLQRTVVDEGKGDDTAKGEQVEAVITVFNGRTGKQALSEPATLTVGDDKTFEAFRASIECVPTGSRVVTTVVASDVYGDQGYPELDIKADDALVVVTDVVDVREEIKAKEWKKDVPKVSLTGEEPKVTLPKTDPPKDVLVKVLKEGDGKTVKAGDSLTVNYQGRTWEDGGKIFQQTFGKDGQPAQMSTTEVVQGFAAGVIGQKVGSTVIVTMPPEYGFGTEPSEQNPLAGKSVLFVVEIVSINS
ncbi:FKBP-type peptidyl-prolyl cis-trans isomerase [Aeromicrobium duanguangcaii]|uniref:Peptidyl-prolyl cis-trans isomerase n=1 Tax=Aeromicrobium duanguangcaii TaxID=2968086 RepID=A0ABY5KEH5_9ACTN|nr:FKBP-type peptidyl-prolyl cis-trans isomerase [Aeromicrobium duanguangcaii]MCD9155434.1 FKBP-type peptidyl-prolyl cis-trans isomerase [Aeromicrobium duanguangcaii]UUI68295.1 FKBP-type peptidyl-prolyl cis-trans isomerase [Aeromicrobium duanguangcaii]